MYGTKCIDYSSSIYTVEKKIYATNIHPSLRNLDYL